MMIKRFEDLPVWQAGRELVKYVYSLTKQTLFKNDFGLKEQVQRSAVSVPSNIAEGFERGTKQEFIQFLYVARGSAGELRSQLYNAYDTGYISQDKLKDGVNKCVDISKQIASFIKYLKDSDYKGDKFKK
ncbi:MAG: four helix bundle protein [Candidatus Brocadiia bacterium]